MATLVTGATGFIGSHIARKLVDRGVQVKVLLRKSSKTTNIDDIDVEKVYGDVMDMDSINEALSGCDTLYHTAGVASFRKEDYQKMEDINVDGTSNILNAAVESGIKKVVHTSSIAAIGVDSEGGVANEETEYDLDYLGVKYLDTKHRGEQIALDLAKKGLPLVVVNPATVIGTGDIYLSSTAFILWYYKKKFPGYMDGTLNMVDVEDVAEGHILAAEKGGIGERYILGNKNFTLLELFSLLEEVTGVPKPKMKIPYFMALASGYFVERILGMSFPNYSTMDLDSVKLSKLRWHFDSSKAINELGYQPRDVKESVKNTLEWFRENGYLD
ncbi:MAG: dihydroflavonol-4-reductase [Thermodesulfobacteriota bacterium]|nr:MAG: dihydroflavonol-4-reductase [Thermodesulfobacteriota bacterium]